MRAFLRCAPLLALPLCCEAAAVTPIDKVLELLNGMVEKAHQGMQAEKVQWTKYSQFCSDAELEKQGYVKKADLTIESLTAEVQGLEAEIARLEAEVKDREQGIVDRKAELKEAGETRILERTNDTALRQDYTESIHALTEAVKVLKEQNFDRPQAATPAAAAALLQRFGGASAADALLASVGAEPGEANGYEFQSGGVVTLLEKLLDDFRDRLSSTEKEAMTSQHAYETLAQDLTAEIRTMEHSISKMQKRKQESAQDKAEAESQLKTVSATRADDAEFLQELAGTCQQKSTDFEARQNLRGEEIEALSKAIETLSGSAVAGAAEKHLPSFAQLRSNGRSLLQIQRAPPQGSPNQTISNTSKVVAFLKKAGATIKSQALTALASKLSSVSSGESDPFAKVKDLISQLILRLKAEAAEEAQHKAWCDDELTTNAQTRTSKTEEVEGLHTTIDQLEGQIAVLQRDLSSLTSAVAALTAEMARLDKIRREDQAKNEDTIADAAGAQMTLADAIKMLKDYYGKASAATALVQQHRELSKEPPIFQKSFNGQQTESSNILAFLEVIQSDFARLEQETTGAEEAAKKDYDDLVATSNKDLDEKKGLIQQKTNDQGQKQQDLVTARSDLELAQGELDTALEYYDKLKPSCVAATDAASSAAGSEERIKRREQEITALQEALEIFNGETLGGGVDALYSSVDGGNYGMDVQQ